jgi:hypothetical protein
MLKAIIVTLNLMSRTSQTLWTSVCTALWCFPFQEKDKKRALCCVLSWGRTARRRVFSFTWLSDNILEIKVCGNILSLILRICAGVGPGCPKIILGNVASVRKNFPLPPGCSVPEDAQSRYSRGTVSAGKLHGVTKIQKCLWCHKTQKYL